MSTGTYFTSGSNLAKIILFRSREKIIHLDTEKDWINLTMTHFQSFMKCSKIWNQNVKHFQLRRSMHSFARYINATTMQFLLNSDLGRRWKVKRYSRNSKTKTRGCFWFIKDRRKRLIFQWWSRGKIMTLRGLHCDETFF